jgi:hypothetical protein
MALIVPLSERQKEVVKSGGALSMVERKKAVCRDGSCGTFNPLLPESE